MKIAIFILVAFFTFTVGFIIGFLSKRRIGL